MSASDENQSDAKKKPTDDAKAASKVVDAIEVSGPSGLKRKIKLYGILFAIAVVAILVAVGAYPYWRADAGAVVARVGGDLESLEARLGIPEWLKTHGREAPGPATPIATVTPGIQVNTDAVPKISPSPEPPTMPTTTSAAPNSVEITEGLADRLAQLERKLSAFEERLEAHEHAEASQDKAADVAQSSSGEAVPVDIGEKLDTIAARLATVEDRQEEISAAGGAPARATDSSALIGTVVALAERVAAMEASGSAEASALAALHDDALSLKARVAGLDEEVKLVGAALNMDTPAHDQAVLLLLSVGQLSVATTGPKPFKAQFDALKVVAGDHVDLTGPLERLAPHAATGARTFVALRAAFTEVSNAVIRSRDVGSPEGVLGQTLSRVASLVTIRKVDEIGSGTVDGALAAADVALGAGDLAAAVAALEALDGAPGEAVRGWLSLAQGRLEVDGALLDLQAAAISALAAAR